MNTAVRQTNPMQGSKVSPETLAAAQKAVHRLLVNSQAFRTLPLAKQKEIEKHTLDVAAYLAEPEGIKADRLAGLGKSSPQKGDPYAFALADEAVVSTTITPEGPQFKAQAAREGAAVAGALLQAVDFPNFVSSLIEGVFHSIVKSSIEQMEAYGKLVADVAKSLNQFRDDNVTENQARDQLIEQFPDTFQLDVDTGDDGSTMPRVRLKDGVDESDALKKVNSMPIEGGPIKSLDDETIEDKLVPAARTQLATSRQQLLATMVLMGINRIIVTDGRISAKVMYDFQAHDTFKSKYSATQFDYGKQYKYASGGDYESSTQGGETKSSYSQDSGSDYQKRDASYYSKGTYKNTAEPVLKLASATQAATDAELKSKASLAGQVEVNFKSETFPLEKMADSFQIGRIQNAAKPKSAAPTGTATATPPAVQPAAPVR